MSEEREKQGDGFSVKDKRRFTEGGEPQEGVGDAEPAGREPMVGGNGLPDMDFSTFILSLSSSAMMHMGELGLPGGGTVKKDLALAQQSIDILDILKEKTRGNLSVDEEQLLHELLYSTRLAFVKAAG